ncbi:MAG: penicillin acylase family protein, partial [Actinomycetota bacterium]
MRGYLGVRGRERGGRGLVRLVAVAASLTIAGSLAPAGAQSQAGRYREDDRSITALNIIPPGQKGVFNGAEAILAQGGTYPPHAVDQLDMYRDLRRASREDLSQLDRYFKDASFGVAEGQVERDYSPRAGVRILRDKAFGIPHIYGATRGDVMFATGYVTAEDRLFLMDTMRHLGRGRVSEFLGASDANLAMDRAMYAVAGYDDADLQKMMEDSMARYPAEGKMVLDDFNNFAAGANTYINEALTDPTKMPAEYLALQMVPQDWVPLDSMAVGTVIGAQLGVAGGDEIRNASLLLELTRAYGQEEGRKIFEDLRERDDPESPMHTTKRFPYMERGTVDPASVAMPDDPSKVGASQPIAQDHIDGPRGPIRLQTHPSMSNAVVVGGGLTASGRPMAVMGPQVAYWSPEVLIEMDLHGPGIEVRGTAFPGISAYVLMGRGRDYAWSATSSIGDMVDIFAEKLCEPDGKALTTESASYIHNGKCEPMFQRTDTFVAKPSAGGMPSGPNVMVT